MGVLAAAAAEVVELPHVSGGKCPNAKCGAEAADGDEVCTQCGARIKQDVCAKAGCGKALRPGARFCGAGHPVEAGPGGDVPCTNCGQFHEGQCKLPARVIEAPVTPGGPSPGPSPTVPGQPPPPPQFWTAETVEGCKPIFDEILGFIKLPPTDDEDMEECAPYFAAFLQKYLGEFGPYDVEIKAGFFAGKLLLSKLALKRELAEARTETAAARGQAENLRVQNEELRTKNADLVQRLDALAARLDQLAAPPSTEMKVEDLTAPGGG